MLSRPDKVIVQIDSNPSAGKIIAKSLLSQKGNRNVKLDFCALWHADLLHKCDLFLVCNETTHLIGSSLWSFAVTYYSTSRMQGWIARRVEMHSCAWSEVWYILIFYNFLGLIHISDINKSWFNPQPISGNILLTGLHFPFFLFPIMQSIWFCPLVMAAYRDYVYAAWCRHWQWTMNK